jgi:hypothetical protein
MTERIKYLLLVVLIILLIYLWGPRWRSYPAVTSPEALGLIKLMYNVASAEDRDAVKDVYLELADLKHRKLLSPAEIRSFDKILDLLHSEEFAAAAGASRQFAEDQLGRGQMPSRN